MQKTMDGYLFPIMNQFELKYFKLSDFFKYFFFFQKQASSVREPYTCLEETEWEIQAKRKERNLKN